MNLFGTDGIRGIANAGLSWHKAFRLGRAMGIQLSPGTDLCVGKDTRASGDMLEASIVAGITSTGRNVVRLGVITTPGLSYLVKELRLGGGVMISASHNPGEYNGLKVFGPDGRKVPDATEVRFSEFVEGPSDGDAFPTGRSIGRVLSGEVSVDRYVDFLCGAPKNDLSRLRVVLDTANGSTSFIAAKVWTRLAGLALVMNNAPDGSNINERCGSTHPYALAEKVASARAAKESEASKGAFDAGFSYDGDGDRCIAVDETGVVQDGDHIMVILALDMAQKGRLAGNAVVGTVMSNYGLEVGLRKHGISLERTPVGDRYVLEKMEELGFRLGGEQSGHIIVRDILWAGDGILTSLLVADVMAGTGKTLSELASVMSSVPQHLVNVRAADPKGLVKREPVVKAISKAQSDLGNRGRVLVRPSGTEPLVRIMVESLDPDMVHLCIQYLEEVIRRENEAAQRA
jgi:phosphoglucosamine mutase